MSNERKTAMRVLVCDRARFGLRERAERDKFLSRDEISSHWVMAIIISCCNIILLYACLRIISSLYENINSRDDTVRKR